MNMTETSNFDYLHSLPEIDNLIKKYSFKFKYSLSDAILFLLFVDENPIKGKIKQMKEVFLLLNEVLDKQGVQPAHFEKKRYGPYSEEVAHTIEQLIFSNYLSVNGKKNSNDFAIEITPLGREYIEKKYSGLPRDVRETLRRKREEWDTHTSTGLLKLVYTHYNEFLENSVFKNRYRKLDWDDDNQRLDPD